MIQVWPQLLQIKTEMEFLALKFHSWKLLLIVHKKTSHFTTSTSVNQFFFSEKKKKKFFLHFPFKDFRL